MKLRDLFELPEKEEHTDMCDYHFYGVIGLHAKGEKMCSCGASDRNEKCEKIGNIEVEVDETELANLIFLSFAKLGAQVIKEGTSNPDKQVSPSMTLAKAISQNIKKVIKVVK